MARTRRVDPNGPGIRRKGRGLGFSYHEEDGQKISDKATLERIRSLAIPPAWREVWICPHPRGHVQATGLDDADRKQYRYHDDWREHRDRLKFEEMEEFAAILPAMRERLDEDLRRRGLVYERVCACSVRLLDFGLFRIGSERYENDNASYGLTTIKRKHVRVTTREAVFDYPSKSGQRSKHRINDPVVMPTLDSLKRRTGGAKLKDFLVYRDGKTWKDLVANDVNAFIKETGGENFSAKDFRTWNATVVAAMSIAEHGREAKNKAERKRVVLKAVEETARLLNNTPAVCRSSYIDPRIFDRYEGGETIAPRLRRIEGATDDGEFADRDKIEAAVLALLRG